MEYIDRCNEETKARRLKETWVAIAELHAGKLVDGGEVLDWLDSWGTDDEHARYAGLVQSLKV